MSLFSYKVRAYYKLVHGSGITVDFYKMLPVKPLFTTISRSMSDQLSDDNAKDTERRNLHTKNQLNHNKKGPIYQEEVGPDVKVVFVADPTSCAKIFREGI